MPEYLPWAEKIRREYDAGVRLLRQRPFLAGTAIIIFTTALLLWAGYSVYGLNQKQDKIERLERDKKQLQDEVKSSKVDYERQQEIVAPVLLRAAKEFPGEEINASLKKLVERLDLTSIGKQTLRSAQATIDLKVSDSIRGGTYLSGAYVAFGRGNESILIMNTASYVVRSKANNETILAAETRADANDLPQDKKASFLSDTDYIQFGFGDLPENYVVLGGKITLTLNGTATLNFSIPPQRAEKMNVFIRNIQPQLKLFLE